MPVKESRRTILRRVGLLAIGASGITTLMSRGRAVAQSENAPSKASQIARVRKVNQRAVWVDGGTGQLRLEGFPDGWQAAIGDKVAVRPTLEGTGMSAQPVAHWVTVTAAPADLKPGVHIGSPNGPQVVAATVLDAGIIAGRRANDRKSRPLNIAVADRVSAGDDRILAIREMT